MIAPDALNTLGVVAVAAVTTIGLIAAAATRRGRRGGAGDRVAIREISSQLDALRDELDARAVNTDARLNRIEQIVESLAIEVERVGEGQRFVSKLLAGRAPEPTSDPRP
jgi:hypothetical protein